MLDGIKRLFRRPRARLLRDLLTGERVPLSDWQPIKGEIVWLTAYHFSDDPDAAVAPWLEIEGRYRSEVQRMTDEIKPGETLNYRAAGLTAWDRPA